MTPRLGDGVVEKSKSAPSLSILLMKQMRGTPYRSACRHTVSDWASTPSLPSKTTFIEDPHAFNFNGEVNVAGSVDEVDVVLDLILGPEAGGCCRLDRDATLLFFFEVHGGGAFVHFADLVAASGVVQNAAIVVFARVNVGINADVADLLRSSAMDVILGNEVKKVTERRSSGTEDSSGTRRRIHRFRMRSRLGILSRSGRSLISDTHRRPSWTYPAVGLSPG